MHESLGGTAAQGPAADPQAQQTVAMLDTQTLLYLLALLDRLSKAEEEAHASSSASPIEAGENLVVESEPWPAAPEEEDTQDVQDPFPPRPWRKRRLGAMLLILCILIVLAVMAVSLLPLVTASATVTIIPVQRAITATTQLAVVTSGPANPAQGQVPGRRLSALTLSQQETVPTTGIGHQPARAAQGSITFYNALPATQTVAAGTLLVGADGVQVVTEQDAILPAAAPPVEGQASVPAHTLLTGPGGNITARDINGACCLADVFAMSHAFGGGQDARSYPMVTREDMSTAVSTLKASLMQSVEAAFAAQLHQDETLITPVPCIPSASADHAIGGEAAHLTVAVDATCTGESYRTQAVQTLLKQIVTLQATAHLGTGYTLAGDVQVSITHVTYTNQKQGSTLTLQVHGTGTWAYQFDDARLQHMTQLIAGKSRQQATQLLLQLPGVSQVSMTVSGTGGTTSLPADAGRIHVLVLYRAA